MTMLESNAPSLSDGTPASVPFLTHQGDIGTERVRQTRQTDPLIRSDPVPLKGIRGSEEGCRGGTGYTWSGDPRFV